MKTMKTNSRWFLGLASCCVSSLAVASVLGADAPYHLLKEIPAGGAGGYDYLTLDIQSHNTYLSVGSGDNFKVLAYGK